MLHAFKKKKSQAAWDPRAEISPMTAAHASRVTPQEILQQRNCFPRFLKMTSVRLSHPHPLSPQYLLLAPYVAPVAQPRPELRSPDWKVQTHLY